MFHIMYTIVSHNETICIHNVYYCIPFTTKETKVHKRLINMVKCSLLRSVRKGSDISSPAPEPTLSCSILYMPSDCFHLVKISKWSL